jgi:excisionase family DNA binding protein
MPEEAVELVDVTEAGRRLGVSISTVWRMIRRGELPSIRKGGRRLVPRDSLVPAARVRQKEKVPPLDKNHPIFRLVGAGRSGGKLPGARDKHAIVDS